MAGQATVLHLDLDAFYAAVEQRDKPSLRAKPVVVGGIGPRGVVATSSYEARRFGVHSAMSMGQAHRLCPQAAFLGPRFEVYRRSSDIVLGRLRELSPLLEPLSLDEAYVDLAGRERLDDLDLAGLGRSLRADVRRLTGGLTASVGLGSSKLVAKVASELAKPDGLRVVAPGTERELLGPLPVSVLPGVGPATAQRLRRVGARTVAEVARLGEQDLVSLLGEANGRGLFRLANADDDRPVQPQRETKSVSVEDTFDTDRVDAGWLRSVVARMAGRVCERLQRGGLSGRTVTLKLRRHDFSTHSRSLTLPGPTDDRRVVAQTAQRLLAEVDTSGGVRLLGVGVSGLTDWIQEDLFTLAHLEPGIEASDDDFAEPAGRRWWPGLDVLHDQLGPGWVWGSGLGRVTVRFETASSPPGPVRTFDVDDPALSVPSPPPLECWIRSQA